MSLAFVNGQPIEVAAGGSGYPADGRLTLASGSPAPTSVGPSGTLYYTPYLGNKIALYNGTTWQTIIFAETPLSLTGVVAATNYDVWGVLVGGALALELHGWASSGAGTSTRATALARQDGVLVKSGDPTRRYLGTIRGVAPNQSIDVNTGPVVQRFVWNYYNRVQTASATASGVAWGGASGTWAAINSGEVAYIHEFVNGLVEDSIEATCIIAAALGSAVMCTVGLNGGFSGGSMADESDTNGGFGVTAIGGWRGYVGNVGYFTLNGLFQTVAGPLNFGGDSTYNRMHSVCWR